MAVDLIVRLAAAAAAAVNNSEEKQPLTRETLSMDCADHMDDGHNDRRGS